MNELATHGIASTGELCDDHEGGSSSREEEEGDEHGLEPLRNFAANKTVKSFFYVRSICGCNKERFELHIGGFN